MLKELIYKQITEDKMLAGQLAKYAGKPAVFYYAVPADTDPGWDTVPYPQLRYTMDMRANQESKSVGSLKLELFCQKNDLGLLEQMERWLQECLKDVLMRSSGNSAFGFSWADTTPLDVIEEGREGCRVIFDILEYPCQTTTDPDPIEAVNQYIKAFYPDAMVLWLDESASILMTASGPPFFYCRLETVGKGRESNAAVWMNVQIAVYLLCPDAGIRTRMLAALANRMSLEGELPMLDHSPMFIKNLQVNYQSDYLREGQLLVTGEYGILRYPEKTHTIRDAKMIYKKGV